MAAKDHDRNLLFGILAVQMDFITRDALVTAMHAWVLAKDKPLGEILVEQKALVPVRRTLLEALVDEHLKQHDNDPEKSLAAVSSLGSVRNDLLKINDPEVQASLVHVSAAHSPAESFATRVPSVGSSTSSGTRFRILRPHAEGGLGKVSVARDEELQREVALKEIKDRHADNPESRSRFMLEAEITGGLEHPSIVPVYGLGQYADGRPYYAMRFIRGDSLKERVDRYHDPKADKSNAGERAVELRKLLGRFLDVCNAIAYAHTRGVLHRDLKPGNIMLGEYGETLVVDWGLAKPVDRPDLKSKSTEGLLRPSSSSGSAATQMGSALGTPQYMSPEQAAGRLDLLGPASDVYSLGATLYYVLTGKPPIEAEDIGAVLKNVERGEFPPPRALNSEIAVPLEAICLKAMALKAGDRYLSPKDLAEDVEHWLADEPVTAYREPLTARAIRWGRKHKTLVAGSFGLVSAAAIALAVSTIMIKQEQILTDQARQRADANAIRADERTRDAQTERARAQENARTAQEEKKKANRQLALSYIDRGVDELDRGDRLRGFAILGQAYRAASDAPSLRPSVCSLLGAWEDVLPCTLKHDEGVDAVAFSPDGTKIATASCEKTARLWDAVTGKPLGTPLKHDDVVNAVAFSPDGTKIATASRDKTARLWDAATGKPLGTPLKHDESVHAVAFSPDGTKIATASDDKTARLWDTATGKPLGRPLTHDEMVVAVAFSPDGTKIATASFDMTARLWTVPKAVDADPSWIAAYVRMASQLTEDADSSLHPLACDEADACWRELLKSPAWLEDRTKRLEECRRVLHLVAADEQETADNWFAAAFHLRWLAKLEHNNPEWKARLAKAEEHLAEAAKSKPVDSGKTH